MENSIRVVKEWLEESAKHGLENYIDDVKFETTEKRNKEIAKNLLTLNIAIDDITKATGLSKKQILKLK